MLLHTLVERYGPTIIFVNTLAAALGVPVPGMPTLIVVGASIAVTAQAQHSTTLAAQLFGTVLLAVAGGLLGELVWFGAGRRFGPGTLQALCRVSLSLDTCVRKTEHFYEHWGVRILLVAKFIPGLSLVSVPLAGAMRVPLRSFLLYAATGLAIWAGAGLLLGAIFARQLDLLFALLAQLGARAMLVAVAALAVYVGYRWYRRRKLAAALQKAQPPVAGPVSGPNP